MEMATVPLSAQVSVEEYEQNPALFERHEFVHGCLIEKPVPTWKHSKLQIWLGALLLRHTRGLAIGSELHGKVNKTIWRIPDVAVQVESIAENEKYALAPLLLAVEILSPEDSFTELQNKLREYHVWGVPFCWLFDPENECAWTLHKDAKLDEVSSQEYIRAGEIQVPVAEIFSVFHPA